ncbi:Acetyl-CoA carboxylase beta subunit [Streptomyces sp. 3213]|nr:Acetyl-CoA carboxylase beta subunit [Streptomyces sp. 3213] [Streptomyces sp. 3213.3]
MTDRRSAREILALVADDFAELPHPVRESTPDGPLAWQGYDASRARAADRTGESESVVCGTATVGGTRAVLIAFEFGFLGGSLGERTGDRLESAYTYARDHRLPVVPLIATGGSRMQEGMIALTQLQRVARQSALTREAGLPQIAVLRDPTTGGGWATLGAGADVILALPGAQVGFAGSRVRPPDADPTAYTAEAQVTAGAADAIVEPGELRATLGSWLRLLTTPWEGQPPVPAAPGLPTPGRQDPTPAADPADLPVPAHEATQHTPTAREDTPPTLDATAPPAAGREAVEHASTNLPTTGRESPSAAQGATDLPVPAHEATQHTPTARENAPTSGADDPPSAERKAAPHTSIDLPPTGQKGPSPTHGTTDLPAPAHEAVQHTSTAREDTPPTLGATNTPAAGRKAVEHTSTNLPTTGQKGPSPTHGTTDLPAPTARENAPTPGADNPPPTERKAAPHASIDLPTTGQEGPSPTLDATGPPAPPHEAVPDTSAGPPVTGWEAVQRARDPRRARAERYLDNYFTHRLAISGDRCGGTDAGMLCGFGERAGRAVAFAAQAGTATRPAGYRTAARLIRLADRLGVPVLTLVDTPGAANDAEAEREGAGAAIADLFGAVASARVPVTTLLIGEGGSGGALALAAPGNTWATPDSYFSVIAPELATAILKRPPAETERTADQLRVRPEDLAELGVIRTEAV